jgi:hypothetical protein
MSDTLSLADTLAAATDVLAREVDGEIVILSLDRASYFGLNKSGAYVWQAIVDKQPLREAATALGRTYGIPPAQADNDVLDVARQLIEAGLVVRAGDAASV